MVDRQFAYEFNDPAHRLGQYRAWDIPGSEALPLDLIWISIADSRSPASHRVLPHGEPSIGILRRRDRDGGISNIRLVLCGPSRQSIWYRPNPREELIAVRLKPEWSADIFDISPVDTRCLGSNMLDAPRGIVDRCSDTLKAAESAAAHDVARILLFDLLSQANKTPTMHAPERDAMALIRQMSGQVKARELAQMLDISERHLRRRFRSLAGCSPKFYARQLRLSSAVIAAENSDHPHWAQLAYASGFHDQAHMINEFKAMLGLTPSEVQKERRALAAFCNI